MLLLLVSIPATQTTFFNNLVVYMCKKMRDIKKAVEREFNGLCTVIKKTSNGHLKVTLQNDDGLFFVHASSTPRNSSSQLHDIIRDFKRYIRGTY